MIQQVMNAKHVILIMNMDRMVKFEFKIDRSLMSVFTRLHSPK